MKLLIPIAMLLFAFSVIGQTEATTPKDERLSLTTMALGNMRLKKAGSETTSEAGCSTFITTIRDKVTGSSTVSGREQILVSTDGKTGLGIITMRVRDNVVLSFSAAEKGSGCINEYGQLMSFFRDGTRLQFAHNSKFNCDGTATVYFGGLFGKRDLLEQLKTKEIETVRVQNV
jgi:hypothetical protein